MGPGAVQLGTARTCGVAPVEVGFWGPQLTHRTAHKGGQTASRRPSFRAPSLERIGVWSMSMGKAKQKATPKLVDLPTRVAEARARVEAEGAIKLSALGPPAVRGLVAAELGKSGLELTKAVVRKPVAEQLKQALADGAFIALKRVAAHVAGATPAEAKRAAIALVDSAAAHLVLRGKEEVLVPASAGVLSRKELAAFEALAKVVAKAARAKNGLSLLRADFSEALAQVLPKAAQPSVASANAEKKPGDAALSSLLSAVDATRDAQTGLSFVPSVVARKRASFTSDAAREALLTAAHRGLLELRPEGGINRLSAEELALCPPGPQGTRLSWARRTESVAR
jgi:hypothetical protein